MNNLNVIKNALLRPGKNSQARAGIDSIPDEQPAQVDISGSGKTVGDRLYWGARRSQDNSGRHAMKKEFETKYGDARIASQASLDDKSQSLTSESQPLISSSRTSREEEVNEDAGSISLDKIKITVDLESNVHVPGNQGKAKLSNACQHGSAHACGALKNKEPFNPFSSEAQIEDLTRAKTAYFGGRKVKFDLSFNDRDTRKKNKAAGCGLVFNLYNKKLISSEKLQNFSRTYDRRIQDGPNTGYIHTETMQTMAEAASTLQKLAWIENVSFVSSKDFIKFSQDWQAYENIKRNILMFANAPRDRDAIVSDLDAHDEKEKTLCASLKEAFDNADKNASLPRHKIMKALQRGKCLFLEEPRKNLA